MWELITLTLPGVISTLLDVIKRCVNGLSENTRKVYISRSLETVLMF